jgi:cold shock CspA family protein
MAYGRIGQLRNSEGHGFIREAGDSDEFEFHWTALTSGSLDQLTIGRSVEFDIRTDHRDAVRIRAVNVPVSAVGIVDESAPSASSLSGGAP